MSDRDEIEKRFKEQGEGTSKREYPQGRLTLDDDGAIAFRVGGSKQKQVVIIDFNKPTAWIGMSPQEACDLAQCLIKAAREISSTPLVVEL